MTQPSHCNWRPAFAIYPGLIHLEMNMKEEFYILELDEEFIIISITDRGARVVRRGFNSRQEALQAFPQAA
ncbi:MAG TPA: hypothetical protein VFI95_22835 [Terriglobales bacterium]|nr:hypothetical protein [Terriglobales bacterium]